MTTINPVVRSSPFTPQTDGVNGDDLVAFLPPTITEAAAREAITNGGAAQLIESWRNGATFANPAAMGAFFKVLTFGASVGIFATIVNAGSTANTEFIQAVIRFGRQAEAAGHEVDWDGGVPRVMNLGDLVITFFGGEAAELTPEKYREKQDQARRIYESNPDKTLRELLESAGDPLVKFLIATRASRENRPEPSAPMEGVAGNWGDRYQELIDAIRALGYDVGGDIAETVLNILRDLQDGKLKVTDENRRILAKLFEEAAVSSIDLFKPGNNYLTKIYTRLMNPNVENNDVVPSRGRSIEIGDGTFAQQSRDYPNEFIVNNPDQDLYYKDPATGEMKIIHAGEVARVPAGTTIYLGERMIPIQLPTLQLPEPLSQAPAPSTTPPQTEMEPETETEVPEETEILTTLEIPQETELPQTETPPETTQTAPDATAAPQSEPAPPTHYDPDHTITQARLALNSETLTSGQKVDRLKELLNEALEKDPANRDVWRKIFNNFIADLANKADTVQEKHSIWNYWLQITGQSTSSGDSDVLIASAELPVGLLGSGDGDVLHPDADVAWEFLTGVASSVVGGVGDAVAAQQAEAERRRTLEQRQRAAMVASYVNQFAGVLSQAGLVPDTVRAATGLTSAGTALMATENPTFADAVPLLRQTLSLFDLPEDVERVIDVAGTAWDLGRAAHAGDWTGFAAIGAQRVAREIGPRTAAAVGAAIALADVVTSAPNPLKLGLAAARFGLAMNSLVRTFDQVRIDMGEVPLGEGLSADVRFEGFTRSRGPQYRFAIGPDQPNLPPLHSASFSLVPENDGSYRVAGAGWRDPFGIGVEALGEMVTPDTVPGLDPWVTRRTPAGLLTPYHITADLAGQLLALNGGSRHFDIDRSFTGFPLVEQIFADFALDTIYRLDAKQGLPGIVDAGAGEFAVTNFPRGLPQVQGYDDRVVAHFMQPGLFDHRLTFRDADNAALFQTLGLDILTLIASERDLINAFAPQGHPDVQGMIDFVMNNPDRPLSDDLFDVFAYAAANPDLRAHFDERDVLGYLLHYLTAGHGEGRTRHAPEAAILQEVDRFMGFSVLDEQTYRALYPDVAAAIEAGIFAGARDHYRAHGFAEGRMPSFDEAAYLAANSDVAEAVAAGAFTGGIDHWLRHGQHEGRPVAPAMEPPAPAQGFDEASYLAANPDVAEAVANGTMDSALGHWDRHGRAEGRPLAPAAAFNEQAYLAANPDVAAAIADGTMDSAL